MLNPRHNRYGLTSKCELNKTNDLSSYVLASSDNDGLWTSMYTSSQVYKAATLSQESDSESPSDDFLQAISEVWWSLSFFIILYLPLPHTHTLSHFSDFFSSLSLFYVSLTCFFSLSVTDPGALCSYSETIRNHRSNGKHTLNMYTFYLSLYIYCYTSLYCLFTNVSLYISIPPSFSIPLYFSPFLSLSLYFSLM